MHMNCYEEGVLRDLGGSPAEIYERHTVQRFGLMGARDLLDLQPPHVGDRVLDVACGTGAVTRLVAERVAPRGRAIGLDVDPSMLAVGRTVDRHQPGNRETLAWSSGLRYGQASGTARPWVRRGRTISTRPR